MISRLSPHPELLDEQTSRYILDTRTHFEDLRHAASQLAGLLVLAAAGAKSAAPDHPMLEAAERMRREAVDGLRHARATRRSRRHHRHMLAAGDQLGVALASARQNLHNRAEADSILTPLRAAWTELEHAAGALPGFELVSFEQGCCALGARPSRPAQAVP
jgi:hypothetical protein